MPMPQGQPVAPKYAYPVESKSNTLKIVAIAVGAVLALALIGFAGIVVQSAKDPVRQATPVADSSDKLTTQQRAWGDEGIKMATTIWYGEWSYTERANACERLGNGYDTEAGTDAARDLYRDADDVYSYEQAKWIMVGFMVKMQELC